MIRSGLIRSWWTRLCGGVRLQVVHSRRSDTVPALLPVAKLNEHHGPGGHAIGGPGRRSSENGSLSISGCNYGSG